MDTSIGQVYEEMHPGVTVLVRNECAELNGTLNVPNIPLGIAYTTIGLVYLAFYTPCVIVMKQKEFFKHVCYKILFVMGLIDLFSLMLNSLMAGYLLLIGGSICTHPLLNLYGGQMAFALWCDYCAMAILLGLNRSIEFLKPNVGRRIFLGCRLCSLILIPQIYGLYVFLRENGPVFHPILAGFFFDINPMKATTTNYLHAINNFGVTLIVLILNVIMIMAIVKMMRNSKITLSQKVMAIQCVVVCLVMMVASAIYVFLQFCKFPMILTVISTIMWQFSNGAPGIFYLLVNKSMRQAVGNLVLCREKKIRGIIDSLNLSAVRHYKTHSTTELSSIYIAPNPVKNPHHRTVAIQNRQSIPAIMTNEIESN